MLQASLGASIVSLGAVISLAKLGRGKHQGSKEARNNNSSPTSSQCASLWLNSLCGAGAASSAWLERLDGNATIVCFKDEEQQLVTLSGPPVAPNSNQFHSSKHETHSMATAPSEAAEVSPEELVSMPLESLFAAYNIQPEKGEQLCVVFASIWAGGKVLTASKDKGSLPMLKPYSGANTQKWSLNEKGELVNTRWKDVVLGLSAHRVQALQSADALQYECAMRAKVHELEEHVETSEQQHNFLLETLDAEHQEQVQELQQQYELEQRKCTSQDEKLEGLEGLVGQLQSRLGLEHARSRRASEQLQQRLAEEQASSREAAEQLQRTAALLQQEQAACRKMQGQLDQERLCNNALAEQLGVAQSGLEATLKEAQHMQQEAAGVNATLVATHERQLKTVQQLHDTALKESSQLQAEVQQLQADLLRMTSAKEEAFRFLEAMQAQTNHKDQLNEMLLNKCCTLDATLQAINSKIGLIYEERHIDPDLQRSLDAVDLGRLKRRLNQIKDSCSSSAIPSPFPALLANEDGGPLSPVTLQLFPPIVQQEPSEGAGSNSRHASPQASPGGGYESDKSEESQRVESVVRVLEQESSSCQDACSVHSIMRAARSLRDSMRAGLRAGGPRSMHSDGFEGNSAHVGSCALGNGGPSESARQSGSQSGSTHEDVDRVGRHLRGDGLDKKAVGSRDVEASSVLQVDGAGEHGSKRSRCNNARGMAGEATRPVGSSTRRGGGDGECYSSRGKKEETQVEGKRPDRSDSADGARTTRMVGAGHVGAVVRQHEQRQQQAASYSRSNSNSLSSGRSRSWQAEGGVGSRGSNEGDKAGTGSAGEQSWWSKPESGSGPYRGHGAKREQQQGRGGRGAEPATEDGAGSNRLHNSAGPVSHTLCDVACSVSNSGSSSSSTSAATQPSSTAQWLQHLSSYPPPSLAVTPSGTTPPPAQAPSAAAVPLGTQVQRSGVGAQMEWQDPNTSSSSHTSHTTGGTSRGTTVVYDLDQSHPQAQRPSHDHQQGQQTDQQAQPTRDQQDSQHTPQQQSLQARRAPGAPLPALRVDSGERDVPFISASHSSQSNGSSTGNTCCNMGSTRMPPEGSQWGGSCTPNYSQCGTPRHGPSSYCSQVNFWPGTTGTPNQQQVPAPEAGITTHTAGSAIRGSQPLHPQPSTQTSQPYMQRQHAQAAQPPTQTHQLPQAPPHHVYNKPHHQQPSTHHHRQSSSMVSPPQSGCLEHLPSLAPKPPSLPPAENAPVHTQRAIRGVDDVKGADQQQSADVWGSMVGLDPRQQASSVQPRAGSQQLGLHKHTAAVPPNLTSNTVCLDQGGAWDSSHLKQQQEGTGMGHKPSADKPSTGAANKPATSREQAASDVAAKPAPPLLRTTSDQQQRTPALSPGAMSGTGWGEEDGDDFADECLSPFSGGGVQLLQSLQVLRNTPNKRQLSSVRDSGDSS